MLRKINRCLSSRRTVLGAALIAIGLLVTLLFVPFWALLGFVGAAVMCAGIFILIRQK